MYDPLPNINKSLISILSLGENKYLRKVNDSHFLSHLACNSGFMSFLSELIQSCVVCYIWAFSLYWKLNERRLCQQFRILNCQSSLILFCPISASQWSTRAWSLELDRLWFETLLSPLYFYLVRFLVFSEVSFSSF